MQGAWCLGGGGSAANSVGCPTAGAVLQLVLVPGASGVQEMVRISLVDEGTALEVTKVLYMGACHKSEGPDLGV